MISAYRSMAYVGLSTSPVKDGIFTQFTPAGFVPKEVLCRQVIRDLGANLYAPVRIGRKDREVGFSSVVKYDLNLSFERGCHKVLFCS